MRKLLLTITALALGSFAYAQQGSVTGLGVKAHFGFASVSGEDAGGADPALGYAIGGFADFFLTEHVNITPELQYVKRGYHTDLDEQEAIHVDYQYISVPVMAKYAWQMNELRPFLQVGPEFGILLRADWDGNDFTEQTTALDFGLNVGGGVQITQRWGAEMRYFFGLKSTDEGGDTDIRNTGAMFGVTYNFLGVPGR
ncbi:outer membrane beta-barrel protein [bacterium]|nr:outer membrane beta-barrel protein [bacterium]